MKKFIKHIAVISAIFLVLGIFAACSNDPTPPTTTKVTDLKVAPLVDHATNAIKTVVGNYSCSAYYNNSAPNKIYVTIKAADLAAHTNGAAPGVAAYWVGLAIPGKDVKARTYWKDANEKGAFGAGASWKDGETDYTTFYFGSLDGSFKKDGKALTGIIEVGESENNITKTYEITFNVTTNKPFAIGYIKGSGTKDDLALKDADYPDGKKTSDVHSADWVNDTVWIKFDDVSSISGKYVWMKFDGGDPGHQAAISCGNSIKVNKYSACSFVDTKDNNQWEYLADAMKDDIRTSKKSNGKYEGDYTVYVYAFGSNPANPASGTFADFGKYGTLIGISKIKVEKSDATKATE